MYINYIVLHINVIYKAHLGSNEVTKSWQTLMN